MGVSAFDESAHIVNIHVFWQDSRFGRADGSCILFRVDCLADNRLEIGYNGFGNESRFVTKVIFCVRCCFSALIAKSSCVRAKSA